MLSILKAYGRTYDNYMNTPNHIIDLIIMKGNIDAEVSKLT